MEILCAQDADSRDFLRDRVVSDNGDVVARVPVTCAARAEEVDMMTAFEFGVGTVVVQRCAACRYRGADDRLVKRIGRTRDILQAAGIDGARLKLV